MSVSGGALKWKYADVPQRTVAGPLGFEPPRRPVGDAQLPPSAYEATSSALGVLPSGRAPTYHDHEWFTPFAPGALQADTSYVPAAATGTPPTAVATTTSAPTNPRVPALIATQCSPKKRAWSAARVRPRMASGTETLK